VAVGSTRHAAPWKCSMMMLVIGDGTAPYASRSAWTEIYYVLEGEFTIHVGEADVTPRPVTAIAGDVVPLPGGTPHTVKSVRCGCGGVRGTRPGPVMGGFSRAVAPTATEKFLRRVRVERSKGGQLLANFSSVERLDINPRDRGRRASSPSQRRTGDPRGNSSSER
jgi:hypothetical protein